MKEPSREPRRCRRDASPSWTVDGQSLLGSKAEEEGSGEGVNFGGWKRGTKVRYHLCVPLFRAGMTLDAVLAPYGAAAVGTQAHVCVSE